MIPSKFVAPNKPKDLRCHMVLEVIWIIKDVKDHVLRMRHLQGLIIISCFRLEMRVKCSTLLAT